jgi:hypothetical protein
MMATQNDPIKTTLNTNTTSRGQTRQRITPINITTHTRSVLGRSYWKLLTNPDITLLNATTTPLRYHKAKGLTDKPSEKIAWATTIMAHPDILTSYEEGLQKTEEEQQQPNQEQPPPKQQRKDSNTTKQGQRENAPHGQADPRPPQANATEAGKGSQTASR